MTVRRGTRDDLEAVFAVERASETAPHWPWTAYAEALSGEGRCLFVAEEAGKVSGYAIGAEAGGEAELESIAVLRGAQGRGFGNSLVKAVLHWAWTRAAPTVSLEVRAGSSGARRLYERCGFRETGCRRGYYSDPTEDAVLMQVTAACDTISGDQHGLPR